MPHSSVQSLLFHGLALAIGLGTAALVSPLQRTHPQPIEEPITSSSTLRRLDPPSRPQLSSPASFGHTCESIYQRNLSPDERSECLRMLWEQWGKSDPEGMLAYYENKTVWPDDLDIEFYLTSRPDLLLAFAQRQGDESSLSRLRNIEPALVTSQLLAAIPEDHKGTTMRILEKSIAKNLGNQGIPQENPCPSYRSGVAHALLNAGRIDEFLDAFQQVGNEQEMRELAGAYGEKLAQEQHNDTVFEQFLRIPEEYRKVTAAKLANTPSYELTSPEARSDYMRWLERFATAGFVEEATAGAWNLMYHNDVFASPEEIADWLSRFPSDGSWQPITESLIRGWSQREGHEVVNQLCKLPPSPAREALAQEAYSQIIDRQNTPEDTEMLSMHQRLLSLMTNPQKKEKLERWFTERPDSIDPFAPASDPFDE